MTDPQSPRLVFRSTISSTLAQLYSLSFSTRFCDLALSGDICKMYRCVRISKPDDFVKCILWRENKDEEIKTYTLNTIIYGTKPAAFLAIRAMHQLAADEETQHPLGAKIIRQDFYVDDLISGGNSIDEVNTNGCHSSPA